jgi:hypothetical protein
MPPVLVNPCGYIIHSARFRSFFQICHWQFCPIDLVAISH